MGLKNHKILLLTSTLLLSLGLVGVHGIVNQNSAHASTVYSYSRNITQPQRHQKIYTSHQFKLPAARSAIAINRKTGQTIYHKNDHRAYLTASTSKLMTLYLAERKLTRVPHSWHQRVRIPNNLVRMGNNPSFDAFHFKAHRKYSVGDLFKSSFVGSDDNSAIALGEWAGGSNHHFLYMMNKQARLWHINAHFDSACGLENDDLARYGLWQKGGYYNGNRLSAKALAVIAYHLVNDYPQVMKYSKISKLTLHHQKLINENRILKGQTFYVKSLRPDGLKTGWTPKAGLCFVGTSNKKDTDGVIIVLLHDGAEFGDADKLMKFSYKHMHIRKYNRHGQKLSKKSIMKLRKLKPNKIIVLH